MFQSIIDFIKEKDGVDVIKHNDPIMCSNGASFVVYYEGYKIDSGISHSADACYSLFEYLEFIYESK